MDLSLWRSPDLPVEDFKTILQQGKIWLEKLIKPHSPDYRCLAFRAGGWCIQPSEYIIKALLEINFLVDSSVAPGQHCQTVGEHYDFRNAPQRPYWRTEGNVCIQNPSGLYELPILTGNINPLRHLQNYINIKLLDNYGFAPHCHGSYQGPKRHSLRLIHTINRIKSLGKVMLDFSTMPPQGLIAISEQWLERYQDDKQPIPLVGIAHTKNFTSKSEHALHRYLEWAEKHSILFSTYQGWINTLREVEEPI